LIHLVNAPLWLSGLPVCTGAHPANAKVSNIIYVTPGWGNPKTVIARPSRNGKGKATKQKGYDPHY
jgi:hypothetical protein